MIATLPYIEQRFREYNERIFLGRLSVPKFELSRARTFLGQYVQRPAHDLTGLLTGAKNNLIRISTAYDLTAERLDDVIVHEMIHYYIRVSGMRDTSPHGRVFRSMMNDINRRFGRHIVISFRRDGEGRVTDRKQQQARWHAVALMRFADGKTGLKVLPRTVQGIVKYHNGVLAACRNTLRSMELYLTNDIFFEQFPTSSALRLHYVDEEEVRGHLANAEQIACDGTTVTRPNQRR